MKRCEAPGLSGLVAEMIQTTGDIGTQWILHLWNGIVKESCISDDWKSSVVLPIYKRKVTQWSVDFLEYGNEIVGTCYESGGKDL